MSEAVCKGDWSLGSACGTCSRCVATKPAVEPDWPDVSPEGLRKMAEIAAPNNGRVFLAAADRIERAETLGSQAARDVLAERQRQISVEGWTPAHDDEHADGSLAHAASAYASSAGDAAAIAAKHIPWRNQELDGVPDAWPMSWDECWWRPSTPRRNLEKAGALILAEMERLERAALRMPSSRPFDLDDTSRAFVRAHVEAEHAEWTGMKRVYIAGPMTGLPDLNFPAFHNQAARYRARGIEVVNPAEINADPNAKWVDCMRADIRELVTCDGVVMLPGWDRSKGATLEHHIAQSLELRVIYLS